MTHKRQKKKKEGKPVKRALSFDELIAQCVVELESLLQTCFRFDRGDTREARMIALAIRKLVYDPEKGNRTKSTLGQVGMKTKFYDSSIDLPEDEGVIKIEAELSLVGRLSGNYKHCYSPHFGNPEKEEMIKFDEWWNQVVIIDKQGNEFSREDIVMAMADQDGGAHVDSELEELYYRLTRLNSVQDNFVKITHELGMSEIDVIEKLVNTPSSAPEVSPAFYTVRQIAHEILVSTTVSVCDTHYRYNPDHYRGVSMAFTYINEEEVENTTTPPDGTPTSPV